MSMDFQKCCMLKMFQFTDRAGFLVRQFMKHSLYDRISTRPFLTPTEKRWIAFQLLLALQQGFLSTQKSFRTKPENVSQSYLRCCLLSTTVYHHQFITHYS